VLFRSTAFRNCPHHQHQKKPQNESKDQAADTHGDDDQEELEVKGTDRIPGSTIPSIIVSVFDTDDAASKKTIQECGEQVVKALELNLSYKTDSSANLFEMRDALVKVLRQNRLDVAKLLEVVKAKKIKQMNRFQMQMWMLKTNTSHFIKSFHGHNMEHDSSKDLEMHHGHHNQHHDHHNQHHGHHNQHHGHHNGEHGDNNKAREIRSNKETVPGIGVNNFKLATQDKKPIGDDVESNITVGSVVDTNDSLELLHKSGKQVAASDQEKV